MEKALSNTRGQKPKQHLQQIFLPSPENKLSVACSDTSEANDIRKQQ